MPCVRHVARRCFLNAGKTHPICLHRQHHHPPLSQKSVKRESLLANRRDFLPSGKVVSLGVHVMQWMLRVGILSVWIQKLWQFIGHFSLRRLCHASKRVLCRLNGSDQRVPVQPQTCSSHCLGSFKFSEFVALIFFMFD